jgi:hypothetical protein
MGLATSGFRDLTVNRTGIAMRSREQETYHGGHAAFPSEPWKTASCCAAIRPHPDTTDCCVRRTSAFARPHFPRFGETSPLRAPALAALRPSTLRQAQGRPEHRRGTIQLRAPRAKVEGRRDRLASRARQVRLRAGTSRATARQVYSAERRCSGARLRAMARGPGSKPRP